MALSSQEFTQLILMNVEQRQVAANPKTKSTNFGWVCMSAVDVYTHHRHLVLAYSV